MAKKWCGFSIQNELIMHNWEQLLRLQHEPPEPLEVETCDLQADVEEEFAEPVPVKGAKES